ncbi:hydantoinase B/oxoprolinase family protein [Pseudonocardia xishanensis]|uniref:Hydantoinase B/oxoprolinase family protein n=1 Tax=Pseudonocardia xishanensis TaxID=630995 RepID=A0ABP8RW76_9PSEU
MVSQAVEKDLDPVTFEVLKNAFSTIVDQMAEQILRTCYSFVIYARDFSSALCDRDGNTIMQGSQDIAVHVGTLHFTAKAVIEEFGDDINPGDVFALNDPYLGGTHFSDMRIVRPIFHDNELIAFSQSNGHWADVGGKVPGSFDMTAHEHFGEGLRVTPIRIWDRGRYLHDVVRMVLANTRSPEIAGGDLHAQAQATKVAEDEIGRLIAKYGPNTVTTAFDRVQDYVEKVTSQRVAQLPDGEWETEDFLDADPARGEGLVRVRVKLSIDGDRIRYDCSGSDPAVANPLNASNGSAFSGLITGTKMFFPDVPLNSGFYRVVDVDLGPTGSVLNATWPTAVTGFCSGAYEKIVSCVFELWSQVVPERAIASCFNLEYLLVGGQDQRSPDSPNFMWYDWMVGGWGGRNGRDGSNCTSAVFGVGEEVQPFEAQERLSPVVTTSHEIIMDSGGPGAFRGGCGVRKGGTLTDAGRTVMSYCNDRSRSVTWGIEGGLPSMPHGLWLHRHDAAGPEYLGATFSNVAVGPGDSFERPSAGGGGYGDPLLRDPAAVLEDVLDGYVSVRRAALDYGVVVTENDADLLDYEIDVAATNELREQIRQSRRSWLQEDPQDIAARYSSGELDKFDLVRRYGVIVDWGTGELLGETTKSFRAMIQRRAVACWTT